MENIFFSLNAVTVGALLLSIIYTAGVVWRVEMKLDVSYKFFLAGVIFLFLGEAADLYYSADNQIMLDLMVKIGRMLFAVCFLSGVIFMRHIIQSIDGEKEKR